MGLDLAQLLAISVYRAFDLDSAGGRANRLDAFPRALAFLSRHLAS